MSALTKNGGRGAGLAVLREVVSTPVNAAKSLRRPEPNRKGSTCILRVVSRHSADVVGE